MCFTVSTHKNINGTEEQKRIAVRFHILLRSTFICTVNEGTHVHSLTCAVNSNVKAHAYRSRGSFEGVRLL